MTAAAERRTAAEAGPNGLHSPVFASGYQLRASSVGWLWEGAIPTKSLVILEGRKSTGKSTVAAALAAACTGGPSPPGATMPAGRRVLWSTSEDDWDAVVMPRIVAAGGDPAKILRCSPVDHHGHPRPLCLPDDTELLSDGCRAAGVGLIVLDPFVSLASPAIDLRAEQSCRQYLDPLAQLCRDCDLTCILVRHLRKGLGGDAREAGLGSVAVANAARAILRCDEHPHFRGICVMSVVACNYGKRRKSLTYEIAGEAGSTPSIRWGADLDLDADAIAEGRGSEGERGEWNDAERLLVSVLGNGWELVAVIASEAEGANVSPRVLRRAKERLGVRSRRVQSGREGHWEWGCPAEGWPESLSETLAGEANAPPNAPLNAPPNAPPKRKGKKAKAPKAPQSEGVPPKSSKKRRKKNDTSDSQTS